MVLDRRPDRFLCVRPPCQIAASPSTKPKTDLSVARAKGCASFALAAVSPAFVRCAPCKLVIPTEVARDSGMISPGIPI